MEYEIIKALKEAIEDFKARNELKSFIKSELLRAINRDEPKEWITLKGNHIPIKEGQSKKEAIKKFIQNKKAQENEDNGIVEDIADKIIEKIKDSKCTSFKKAEKYPSKIAGVKREKPMAFYQANQGNVNPNFKTQKEEYTRNCQCCVVAYEARRRGYNVKAGERKNKGKTIELARNSAWAWIDPNTNKKAEYTEIKASTPQEIKKYLETNIKLGERYQYSYQWTGKNNIKHRHVAIVERDSNNNLMIYDPQAGLSFKDSFLMAKLKKQEKPRILRIDDKNFNPYFIDDIIVKF